MKPTEHHADIEFELPPADTLTVYISDSDVCLVMADSHGNTLGEMNYNVEDAWLIARKITEAADRAAGI